MWLEYYLSYINYILTVPQHVVVPNTTTTYTCMILSPSVKVDKCTSRVYSWCTFIWLANGKGSFTHQVSLPCFCEKLGVAWA